MHGEGEWHEAAVQTEEAFKMRAYEAMKCYATTPDPTPTANDGQRAHHNVVDTTRTRHRSQRTRVQAGVRRVKYVRRRRRCGRRCVRVCRQRARQRSGVTVWCVARCSVRVRSVRLSCPTISPFDGGQRWRSSNQRVVNNAVRVNAVCHRH